jgi:hypothetical protein
MAAATSAIAAAAVIRAALDLPDRLTNDRSAGDPLRTFSFLRKRR